MGESNFYFHKDGNRWSDMKLTGQSNAMFNNMERISCLCGAELHFFFFFFLTHFQLLLCTSLGHSGLYR